LPLYQALLLQCLKAFYQPLLAPKLLSAFCNLDLHEFVLESNEYNGLYKQ
jgi:hypothetical protein